MHAVIGEKHLQLAQTALTNEAFRAVKEESLEALLRASMIGHTTTVEAFLDSGLDVNARGRNGWTPLLEAVFGGHTETILLILKRGADVNACDQIGWTPLMEAASKGRMEVVKTLLAYGAQVHARTLQSWTALQVTPQRNPEIVRLLREAGACQSPSSGCDAGHNQP
jgi:uncharacterized protein